MPIFKTNEETEFLTDERCHIIEILNHSDYSGLSIARARVEPGETTQLHALKEIDEAYYILSGEGEIETDGNFQGKVSKGDVVVIPRNTSQQIANKGEENLIFLCICVPAFSEGSYLNLEN